MSNVKNPDQSTEGAFVVTDACLGSVDLSCLEVCPVGCIYAVGDDGGEPVMVVIDPTECISCSKCVPECPVEAIMITEAVPEDLTEWIAINAMHSGRGDNDGPAEERAADHQDIADAALAQHAIHQSS